MRSRERVAAVLERTDTVREFRENTRNTQNFVVVIARAIVAVFADGRGIKQSRDLGSDSFLRDHSMLRLPVRRYARSASPTAKCLPVLREIELINYRLHPLSIKAFRVWARQRQRACNTERDFIGAVISFFTANEVGQSLRN